jgi:hypothetical protein
MKRADHDEEDLLAALADGSLPEPDRTALEERMAADPELANALAEQRRARDLIRAAAARIEAPAALRERLVIQQAEFELRGRRPPVQFPRPAIERGARPRRRLALFGGVAVAAAATLLIAVILPAGAPSVVEAATLSKRPATEPVPPRPQVEGVAFPTWQQGTGWRAVGARTDELDGRRITTVFYEKAGKRIGYTIVAGEALDPPTGARGGRFRVFESGGRAAVTWQRKDRTCILSGADVPAKTLVKLAAWKDVV